MGGKQLKWRQPVHYQLWSQQGLHFSPHSTAKTNDKSTFLRRMVSSGISDVVIASVHSEKTRASEEVDDDIIIIIASNTKNIY